MRSPIHAAFASDAVATAPKAEIVSASQTSLSPSNKITWVTESNALMLLMLAWKSRCPNAAQLQRV